MSNRRKKLIEQLERTCRQENHFKEKGSNEFYEELEDGFYQPDGAEDNARDQIKGEKS